MANEMKILITGDASSAMGVLDKFSQSVKGAAGQVEGHFAGMSKIVENFAAPILKITALIGGGAMFKGSIDAAVGFGKEVGGIQRLMGGASKDASVLSIAIGDIFGDVDGFLGGAQKMTKILGKNEDAVKALGVQTRDSNGHFRAMPTLISEINGRLGEFKEGTDRDIEAQKVYGRGYQEMLRYIAMTPEVMDAARKKAEDLGLQLDADGKRKIKGYRDMLNDTGDALLALKLRVGLDLMPSLTALGNWFVTVAPAGINVTLGALNLVGGALSYTTVQVGLLAMVLRGPLLAAGAAVVKTVSTMAATFRFAQIAAVQLAGASSMGGLAAGAAALINPWVAAAAALAALAVGLEYWSKAHQRAMAAQKKANAEATKSTEDWVSASKRAQDLDLALNNAKGAKDRALAQERLNIAVNGLLEKYPDLIKFLRDEEGHQRGIADAINERNKAGVVSLRQELAASEATEKRLEEGIRIRKEWNAAGDALPKVRKMSAGVHGGVGATMEGPKDLEIKANNTLNAQTEKALQLQREKTKGLREQMEVSLSIEVEKKRSAGGDPAEQKGLVSREEAALAIEGLRVEAMAAMTFQQQQAKEEAKAALDYSKAAQKLDDDRAAGKYNRPGRDADYLAEMTALRDANVQKLANIRTEYVDKRAALEDELQGKLTAAEEGGLEKRLEAIRASFAKIRTENAKLAQDGKSFRTEDQIQAAMDAQEAQARRDQIQADLTKLKTELAQLAEINGGKLSQGDVQEKLNSYSAQGGTKTAAATEYGKETHMGEGAGAGLKAGMKNYLAESQNAFQTWKGFATSVLSGAESAFSTFFVSLTQKGSTFGEKTKALWMGISGSVVQGLSKIAAQELINWGIGKAKWAWEQIKSVWNTGHMTKTVTENGIESASNTGTAATAFFKVFAGMGPWGYALAAAAIIAMFSLLGSVTGRKVGGLVGQNGPEMTVLGEEGLEVVAPEHDFKHWASNLQNSGANLGYNLARHDNQVASLQVQAASYGPEALQGGSGRPAYQDFRGTTIITADARQFQDMVHQASKARAGSV